MVNKQIRRCLNLLVIRKMKTLKYYFTPLRLAIIGKLDGTEGWEVCGSTRPAEYHWWTCRPG